MEKYDIAYEVDYYEVIFDNGETHIFGVEENAVWYMKQIFKRDGNDYLLTDVIALIKITYGAITINREKLEEYKRETRRRNFE